ncbi:MAG: tRNA(Ile)-lysidine synthase [Porticoccaceae bacterium]|nr:MAG: tRNA(Ile)-lysidine synthase [Porticoccaceae bacterium]
MDARLLLEPHLARLTAAPRLWVAFSGGRDSTVLLHALRSALPAAPLAAIHVDHGLNPAAARWADHCAELCAAWGVPLVVRRVAVAPGRGGLQQAARRARYQVFAELVGRDELLLTAHHRDDQVETVLLRLLQGGGARALAGMPVERPLGRGRLLRPLLAQEGARLAEYARAHGLAWVEDPANRDLSFERGFLRERLLPLLEERRPDVRRRILAAARSLGEAVAVVEEVAAADLAACGERAERLGWSLDAAAFVALSAPRRRALIGHWPRRRGLPPPPEGASAEVDALLAARCDARPEVAWRGASLRRYRGRLYLLSPLPPPRPLPAVRLPPRPGEYPLPGGGRLRVAAGEGPGALRLPPDVPLEVVFRRGGERLQPAGRPGSAPLKKLFGEYGAEPWLRWCWPLVRVEGRWVAAVGLFTCAPYQCAAGESGLLLSWEPAVDEHPRGPEGD